MTSAPEATIDPANGWLELRANVRVLLDFACGSNHTTNVDQSQIDIAARLILLDHPASDKDWADAYKVVDYLTRIIGPATLEGIILEDEARRDENVAGAYRISLQSLAWGRPKRVQPYLHGYRMETMRFCILTLFLLIAAIYAHSRIIPAQNLLHDIDEQTRAILKLVERLAIIEQSQGPGAAASANSVPPAADRPADAVPEGRNKLQIEALQSEQRDRGVDICFRHAYLKSWYFNQGLASLASWVPFNRVCAIAENEVLAYCTGAIKRIPCHGDDGPWPADPASPAATLPSTGSVASLEQTNEHVIRAHLETIVRIWLPALYGALGACLWVIRERYAQIREVRVSRTRVVSRTSRMMLGAGLGSIVHMFQPLLPQGYEAVSLPALAFLVGYNVEFVFALADEFIKRFAGAQTQR